MNERRTSAQWRAGLWSKTGREVDILDDYAACEHELESLQAVLITYGRHEPGCTVFAPALMDNAGKCSCGWCDYKNTMVKGAGA